MKICTECGESKDFTAFNKSSKREDGLQIWCRNCQKIKYDTYRRAHPEKAKARWKRYYDKNRLNMIQRVRDYEEKIGNEETVWRRKTYTYGLSMEEYNRILEDQKQKCGMCFESFDLKNPSSIHSDHSHITGKVRGLLCKGCNISLGWIEKNPKRDPRNKKRFKQAQTYLRKTEK